MIKPDRYLNPDWSVLNISGFMLKRLSAKYAIEYDRLLESIQNELGDEARENFPYALNFLFLLGKIEYIKSKDAFVLNEVK